MSKKLTPKTTTRVPSLCLHKATGQARATFKSRSFYFGRYGSREAARRYAEWVVLITQDPAAVPITTRARAGHAATIAELINAYEEHHETTFAGRTDDAIRTARSEVRIAGDLLLQRHAAVLVTDFDAPMLVEIRDRILTRPAGQRWCLRTINNRMSRIRSIFDWGVQRGIVDRSVLVGLQAVSPLRAGIAQALVHAPVKEAPLEHVRPVLEHLEARGGPSIQVACVLRFMLMTGCRCAEARKARIGDLDRDARTLTVHEHKTARKTGEPLIFHLTDEVLAVIDRAMLARGAGNDPKAPLFSSTRGAFSRSAVTQAVSRACERAGVPHWSPHRLRHTATNLVRKNAGDAVAKATGGWDDPRMLHRYGREDEGRQRREGQVVLARTVSEVLSA